MSVIGVWSLTEVEEAAPKWITVASLSAALNCSDVLLMAGTSRRSCFQRWPSCSGIRRQRTAGGDLCHGFPPNPPAGFVYGWLIRWRIWSRTAGLCVAFKVGG